MSEEDTRTEEEFFAIGLLELSQRLHVCQTGASEILNDNSPQVIAYLRKCIREWREPSSRYDEAVWVLVNAALAKEM